MARWFGHRDLGSDVWGRPPFLSTPQSTGQNQWNGHPTLAGTTTLVVSTQMVSSASFIQTQVRPLSFPAGSVSQMPVFGVTSVAPGAAFCVGPIGSYGAALPTSYQIDWWLVHPTKRGSEGT